MYTVTFGGWYQRTTLHLSEIYDLFALGHSKLSLDKNLLKQHQKNLNLSEVSREIDYLEYLKATTKDGINLRYYEDGLYILQTESSNIDIARKKLENYFQESLNPAVSYIFSLGAPTPKVLADIKLEHPTVVLLPRQKNLNLIKRYGEIYNSITSKNFSVYKTPKYIFIINLSKKTNPIPLIEMQIFFREFKDQLERYLYIHRNIWEEISVIKEQKVILGKNVEEFRSRLDAYQKTISLIGSRINQMSTYINTRASISKKLNLENQLSTIFQYKFETLLNTHIYIKEIWKMTTDYLNNAIQVIIEVKNQSTSNGIQSLRLITTIGVLSGIIGYVSKSEFPNITLIGAWYFVILLIATWLINKIITLVYQNRKYELKFSKNAL